MFQVVLDRLQAEAAQRPIRIIAYGGCVAIMREQRWLIDCTSSELSDYRLGVFESQ